MSLGVVASTNQKLSSQEIARIRDAGLELTAAQLAEELGCTERTVYRYRAQLREERRESVQDKVDVHVKDRLPNDLRLLDKVMNTAEKHFVDPSRRDAVQWAKVCLQCLELRFNFLGFPGKQVREFDGKSDAELRSIVQEELERSHALPPATDLGRYTESVG